MEFYIYTTSPLNELRIQLTLLPKHVIPRVPAFW